MSLHLHFESINASTFFNWVGIQAEKMNSCYSDRGVSIRENQWGDDISLWVQPWSGAPEEDGRWSFDGEILITHPDNAQPEYDGQEYLASGLLRFEAVTDGFHEMGPGITVTIDYDPSQEIATVLPYVVELFDLVETKTGTVMKQLAQQNEVLRNVIRQRAGAEPEDENVSDEVRELLEQRLKKNRGRFGTYRSLNEAEVRRIVKRCREFMKSGGTAVEFHDQFVHDPSHPPYFALETLRGWMNDPRFAVQEDH